MPPVLQQVQLSSLHKRLLVLLSTSETALSQADLSDATQLSKATISTNLSELVEAGLILKVEGLQGSSRRVFGYKILPEGISALETNFFEKSTDAFSPESLVALSAELTNAVAELRAAASQLNFLVELSFGVKAATETMLAERAEVLELLKSLRADPPAAVATAKTKNYGFRRNEYETDEAALVGIPTKLRLKQFDKWCSFDENFEGLVGDREAFQLKIKVALLSNAPPKEAETAAVSTETANLTAADLYNIRDWFAVSPSYNDFEGINKYMAATTELLRSLKAQGWKPTEGVNYADKDELNLWRKL